MDSEIFQLILAIIFNACSIALMFLRLQVRIEGNKADALARERKQHADSLARESRIRADALAREQKLQSDAEQIQQDSQRIVNSLVPALRADIELLKTNNGKLISDTNRMKNTVADLKKDHTDDLALLTAATVKLTEAQTQLQDFQTELKELEKTRMLLLAKVQELQITVATQEERILALETQIKMLDSQMGLEQQLRHKEERLREQAEKAAFDAQKLLTANEDESNNGTPPNVGVRGVPDSQETSKPKTKEVNS